jgi:hypothetical protein
MEHGARKHAKYSASNAHRFVRCRGQVMFAQAIPPAPDSEHSIEGTRAHELLQLSLLGNRVDKDATPEMLEAFEYVHDFIENLFIARGPHLVVRVEEPFLFPQSIVPREDASGIADLTIIDHMASEAWVLDFKYGQGIAVEARDNMQLAFNAVSLLWRQPIARVNFVIVQPRIKYHREGVVRVWSCGPLEIAEYQAEIEAAIAAAEEFETSCKADVFPEPGTGLTAGAWCRYCPAESACPARERNALAAVPGAANVRDLRGVLLPEPADLGLDRIALILESADALTDWLNRIEAYAKQRAMAGVTIPGHKLVEAQARRQWNGDERELADKLIELSGYTLGEDDVMPRSLATITKMEAALVAHARASAEKGKKDAAAKAMRDAMSFLTLKQTSGNLTLVSDADGRPAVNRAQTLFGGVVLPNVE